MVSLYIGEINRKDLKDSIKIQEKKGNVQISTLEEVNHEKKQNKFCSILENTAALYERFWDMLSDSLPSFERFMNLGFVIRKMNKKIKLLWKNLKDSKFKQSYKIVKIYSSYCENILQDTKKSESLTANMTTLGVLAEGDILMKLAENGDAVIAVSAVSQTICQITQCNNAFCELSGFSKEDLHNAPLDNVIPLIYRESHFKYFFQTCFLLQVEIAMEYDQKNLFLQQRTGYILPIIMKVIKSPSLANSFTFIARIRKNKSLNDFTTYHILTDKNYLISSISSSKIIALIFKLDLTRLCWLNADIIKASQIKINKLLPKIFTLQEFTTKSIDLRTNDESFPSPTSFISIDGEWQQIKTKKTQIIGYYYKLKQDLNVVNNAENETLAFPNNIPQFEFRYSLRKNAFCQNERANQFNSGSDTDEDFLDNNSIRKKKGTNMKINPLTCGKTLQSQGSFRSNRENEEEKSKNSSSKKKIDLSKLPEFYQLLVPQLEKFRAYFDDSTLLNCVTVS